MATAAPPRTRTPRKKADAPTTNVGEFPYRFEVIDLEQTFVDEDYQRPLSTFVEKIKEDFKPWLVGTIVLSKRAARQYAVVDGQTRREGMLANGITQAPALIYEGLSKGQEASLFADLQRERRNIATYYRFRASLVAGEEEAVNIDRITRAAGYDIGPNSSQSEGNTKRAISAIAGLEKLYRRNPQLLERALVVFKDAWQDRYVPNGELLAGMGWFLDDKPDADDELLARRLSIRTPDELRRRASAMREGVGHSGSLSKYMGQIIEGVYRSRGGGK